MCKNETRVTSCWNVIKSFVVAGAFDFVCRQHQCALRMYVTCGFVSSFGLAFLVYFVFIALKQYTYSFVKKCFKLSSLALFVFVLLFCGTCKYFRAAIAMMSYNIIKLNKFDIGGVHKTLK